MLGEPQGKFESLIIENNGRAKRAAGIRTADGKRHFGDLVIVAGMLVLFICDLLANALEAGSWSASIVPEAHKSVEATAGTVMFIDIPPHRQDLRAKFHPDNYPVWSYRAGEGEG